MAQKSIMPKNYPKIILLWAFSARKPVALFTWLFSKLTNENEKSHTSVLKRGTIFLLNFFALPFFIFC